MIYAEESWAEVKHHRHGDDGVSDHVTFPVFRPDSTNGQVVEVNLNEDGNKVEKDFYTQPNGYSDKGIFQNRRKRLLGASQLI